MSLEVPTHIDHTNTCIFSTCLSRIIILVLSTTKFDLTHSVSITGGRIHCRRCANDQDKVDFSRIPKVLVDLIEDVSRKAFTKPNHAGSQKRLLAIRAVGKVMYFQFGDVNFDVADVQFPSSFRAGRISPIEWNG